MVGITISTLSLRVLHRIASPATTQRALTGNQRHLAHPVLFDTLACSRRDWPSLSHKHVRRESAVGPSMRSFARQKRGRAATPSEQARVARALDHPDGRLGDDGGMAVHGKHTDRV
jgi:hypothetical protein